MIHGPVRFHQAQGVRAGPPYQGHPRPSPSPVRLHRSRREELGGRVERLPHRQAHRCAGFKLATKNRCLRRASAPGWPQGWARGWVGYRVARVSRHVGARGVADQGQASRSFSRRVLHLDACPWSATRHARRRDGIPASLVCRASRRRTACCWRAISRGQPRPPTRSRKPALLQVEAPDHASGAVFQTGAYM